MTKGLEALRQEHESILGGIKSSIEHADLGAENSLIQARLNTLTGEYQQLNMIEREQENIC